MDLELLKTFLEVSNTQHFAKAADNLYITQSTVSARIRQLEQLLNSQLFLRNTKNVSLTLEGERFIKHAEAMLLAWNNAKLELSADKETGMQLSLATTGGLWHYVFNSRIASMVNSERWFINALSLSGENLKQYLYSNIIDIALSYNELDQQGFQSQLLGALQLVLVAPKNIAESYNAGETPYIHVDWGESFNLFIARKFSDKQPRIMQTDNAQTAEQLLMHLNACAYLPSVVLDYAKDLTAIDKRKAPVFKRRIYACYSDDNRHQKDIDAMVDALYL